MNRRTLLEMRKSQPEILALLLAKKSVQRGIQWLDQHANPGWYRNFFEPRGERSVFRANIRYSENDPLAIAFECCPQFMEETDGYVRGYKVARFHQLNSRRMSLLGFAHHSNRRFQVPSENMNYIWEHALRNLNRASIPYRHQTSAKILLFEKTKGADFNAILKREPSVFDKIRRRLGRS